jgi:hypothetical protein
MHQSLTLGNATCDSCRELVLLPMPIPELVCCKQEQGRKAPLMHTNQGKTGCGIPVREKKGKKKEREYLSRYTGLNKGQLMSEHAGNPCLWSSSRPG